MNQNIAINNLNKKGGQEMKRVCYFCNTYMGEKYGENGDNKESVFYSVCDECSSKLKLDERLPELLWAIVTLRRQNEIKKQAQTLGAIKYL